MTAKFLFSLLSIIVILSLFSCKGEKDNHQLATGDLKTETNNLGDIDSLLGFQKLYADVQPDWLKNTDSLKIKYSGYIFTTGQGLSKDLSLAKNKAALDARSNLMKEIQTSTTVTDNSRIETFDAELTNSRVLQYYVERKNGKYNVHCLIAYKN